MATLCEAAPRQPTRCTGETGLRARHPGGGLHGSGPTSDVAAQDGDNALRRRLRHYANPTILAIDEIGYLSYGNRHADLLFEIVNRRYETKSTIVTTNRPFTEWGEVFPNATCVISIVDRLIHHSEIIVLDGESYRIKEAKERASKKKRPSKSKRTASSKTANSETVG